MVHKINSSKRSQSEIISVVLLVVLVLIAVAIIWYAYTKLVKEGISDISNSGGRVLVIIGKTFLITKTGANNDTMNITVARLSGQEDVPVLVFRFIDRDGMSGVYNISDQSKIPKLNEERLFSINCSDLTPIRTGGCFTNMTKVEIYALFGSKLVLLDSHNLINADYGIVTGTGPTPECTSGSLRGCTGSNPCKNYTEICNGGFWSGPCTESGNQIAGVACSVGTVSGTCDGMGVCLGPELVLNGKFDTTSNWITGVGWIISPGNARWDGGNGDYLTQNIAALAPSQIYQVKYSILDISSNQITPYLGGTSFTPRASTGSFTERKSAINTQGLKFLTISGSSDYVIIDDVSVKKVLN